MEERQPRKLAVILHADVVGSTILVQKNESLAHARIQEAFRRFSLTIEAYNGVTQELRGDALVAEFARASDAVAAALAFQIENTEANTWLEDDLQPRLRIGISLGEVVIADNTVTGAGVVLAQRVEQLAEPDGVCITGAVHEAVPQYLPFDYSDLGKREAKGFEEPVQVYSASVKAGKQVPPPEPAVSGEAQSRTLKRLWTASAIALLILVVGALAWWQPWQTREEPASVARMAFPLPDKPSIAVLPFSNLSGDPGQEYFSDGLANDIITDLSKFSNLFVIASDSSFTYKDRPAKVHTVSEELGVRYVLQGSVQRLAKRVRINAQLIDALTGRHLWAERYDRDANDLLAAQNEIVETVVATLAIKVDAAERERVNRKDTDSLEAYDYYLRAADIRFDWEKDANEQARQLLEKAVELDGNYARAYAALAWTHVNDWRWGWSEDAAASKELALKMAQRAIQLDPFDPESYWALGVVRLYSREFDKAMPLYEKAVTLNANDARLLVGTAPAWIYIGRVEEAIAQMERGMRLNPHYSDKELGLLGWAYYEAKQYDKALETLLRISEPATWIHRVLTATYVRLGRLEDARAEAAIVLKREPDYSIEKGKVFPYKDEAQRQHYYQALVEAGVPEKPPLPLPDKPSIAVLPFTNMSDDPQQEYFVDGMTEDLITDLSKLSGLFVIARNSSFAYKGKFPDVRQVSRELGVKYVLEGSVRRAGEQVRINAQLIDATTGGHVWAERYDGSLDNVFAMQDEVTQKIVTALAVNLTTEEKASQAQIETNNPKAYDAFLQGWAHYLRRTPDHYVKARDYFETAIELDPKYSRAYAALASVYWKSFFEGWYPALKTDPETVKARAREYLNTAITNPTSLAHQVTAYMHLWRGRWDEAVAAGQRAVGRDPNDADSYVTLAEMLIYAGKPRQTLDSIAKARRLDPHNQGHHAFLSGLAQFGLEQFDAAAASLERALELSPELWLQREKFGPQWSAPSLPLAAAYAYLGRKQEAQALVHRLREQWSGVNVRSATAFWPFQHDADRDRLARGLLEAGLAEYISDVQ